MLQQTVQMRIPVQRCVQVLQHSVGKYSAVLRQIGVVLYEVSVGCVHLGGGCAEVEYVSCVYQCQCVRDVLVRTVCAQLVGAHGGHEVVGVLLLSGNYWRLHRLLHRLLHLLLDNRLLYLGLSVFT